MNDSTTKKVLEPPLVNVLMDDDDRWDETGLLPADRLSSPLSVEVPPWEHTPTPGQEIYLEVFWDNVQTYTKTWSSDIPSIPVRDLIFEVPVSKLIHGVHTLRYTVSNSDGNTNTSLDQEVTVDMVSPSLGANRGQLQFDTVNVTDRYLSEHDHKLIGVMPAYNGGKAGDVVKWYWSEDPINFFDSDVVSTMTLQRESAGKSMDLVFDEAMILERRDGKRYAFYTVFDRAGNPSQYSQPVELLVAAQPAPRVLPPPTVKEAEGSSSSSTLNPKNAMDGVTVQVPADAVIKPGEMLCVQWGEPDSVGAYRSEKITEAKEFKVPNTYIAQHFGKSIPVYYDVFEIGVDTPHSSTSHTLTVLKVTGFPTVQCDKVSGGLLKLGSIASGGKASFTIDKWFLMATDQFIDIEVLGADDAGKEVKVPVLEAYKVPKVDATIDVGHITKVNLQRFRIGAEIEVRVYVSFDEMASWQRFPSLRPRLES
ncbi:hypothetical protein [Pseudomonas triticifolii]|uniref:Ig-like domain-containing protein n=1 Tax=Pseudomonas triticifolii TaxID=2762592 RepID=A0ABR7BAL2_9PSED|nr:hypothetical protein [Pseudomonas triticifolii]MBC3954227.1 hypothetical protein [Pseudomonas triticifolii]